MLDTEITDVICERLVSVDEELPRPDVVTPVDGGGTTTLTLDCGPTEIVRVGSVIPAMAHACSYSV